MKMKLSGMQTAEMAERLQEVLETKEEAVGALTADVLRLTNQVGELGLALNEARARAVGCTVEEEPEAHAGAAGSNGEGGREGGGGRAGDSGRGESEDGGTVATLTLTVARLKEEVLAGQEEARRAWARVRELDDELLRHEGILAPLRCVTIGSH